jgi:hypothetical protein
VHVPYLSSMAPWGWELGEWNDGKCIKRCWLPARRLESFESFAEVEFFSFATWLSSEDIVVMVVVLSHMCFLTWDMLVGRGS